MANLSKLSSIGGVVVAGAALGLYLGSSAISEINPAYYSTPSASSFHTDLVPNPGDRDSVPQLPELAAAETDSTPSCVSCGLSPDEYAVINYPSADSYGTPRTLPAEIVLAEADEYVSRGLSPSDARDIERYAHFRVSEDEQGPAVAVAKPDKAGGDGAAAAKPEGEAAPGV
jgi:hypothetical protein